MPELLASPSVFNAEDTVDFVERTDLKAMNELLRVEIALADAYRRVMELMPQDRCVGEWIRIRSEHQRAVTMLAIRIRVQGGEPLDPSLAWRMSALTMFGSRPQSVLAGLIRELIRAEEQMARCYEETLEGQELSDECHEIVRDDFLPRCREDIRRLSHMQPCEE
ncbi:MAG: hypothetical protein U0744_12320 [Gemmataceae bacterium]